MKLRLKFIFMLVILKFPKCLVTMAFSWSIFVSVDQKYGGIICRPNLIRWNESLLYINLFYIVLKRQCCLKMSNDNIICQNKLKILKTFLILCKLYTNIHCKKFNMPLSFNMIFDENFSNWCYFSCASPCC